MRKHCGKSFVLWLVASLTLPAAAQTARSLSLPEIVSRMHTAEKAEQNRPSYSLLREYRLTGADPNVATSQVLAEVDYVPPSRKEFSIRKAEGSERGEKIVQRVLEHEANMAKGSVDYDFCTDNYDFALLGQEVLNGRPTYVLQLTPKREAVELLRGKAWVDAQSFLVVRAEGEPAKSPSWWIKDLEVVIDYGRADGVWLPLATRATAELRLVGTHTLTSKDLEVHAATENAKLTPPRRSRARGANNSALEAVWISR
ncbi:MAG: outer membrane lipoprotein-sorting protein [Candidatus Korobacteraceae bacterium]